MPLPDPLPGLVVRYSYLWYDQRRRRQEEGSKDRPCVVVLAIRHQDGDVIVTVAPVTHQPPPRDGKAVEIPPETKRRLGLDDAPSWIVTNELNEFAWPGPDLRSIGSREPKRFAYGFIPRGLFGEVKAAVVAHLKEHGLKLSRRT